MSSSTSNLSVDEQQATAAAKRKDDAAAMTTTQGEQEALIAVVAVVRKALDEAHVHERAATIAWEKEKIIAHHLEQQLAAAQGIVVPQHDDDDHSINVGSNSDTTLAMHLHTQATGIQKIRSVVTIILEHMSPHYKWWCDLMLLMLHRYTLDDHILSNIVDPSTYWARLDNIMVTWILHPLPQTP
jgi:hypothetical protein